jgi:hypothetical protein
MSIENLLNKLGRVRKTGTDRWIASCPTRQDRNPSMTIRQLNDGRILIHDFGGSSITEILDAIGLTFCDLFPDSSNNHIKAEKRPVFTIDAFNAVIFEVKLIYLCAIDIAKGRCLSIDETQRLVLSIERIQNALIMAGG